MQKKKVYDIADSNIALLGSKLEKDCKLESAKTEEAWKNAGKKVGMQIWRIEQFKVKAWPTAQYGQFYTGDSYICLNTYSDKENPDKLKFDVHFWLGTETTQDEAGTAAYKTVELDTLLGDVPVQHREVEGCESSLFLSYFNSKGGIRILEGGVASGFNHVKPTEYKPRLMHVKGRKNIRVVEVPLTAASLNTGDCFIVDNGMVLYQWNGKAANTREKIRAGEVCRALDDERKGLPKMVVVDQGAEDEEFWAVLGGAKPIADDVGGDDAWETKNDKQLWRLSDEGARMEFNKVAEGDRVSRDKLDTKDVFILDAGMELFVWIGKQASDQEKQQAMFFASKYLQDNKRPPFLPVTRVLEGGENDFFNSLLNNGPGLQIKKAVPSTVAGVTIADGQGCYLTYSDASNGTLFLNWSKASVGGALAYFKPTKTVAAFKFTTQGGREELTRGTDNTPKNLYQGWCNYLKMAREYKAEVTLYTNDVQVCVHDNKTIDNKEVGATWSFNNIENVAVGVFKKSNDVFGSALLTTGRDHFLSTAQAAGAALVLPK